MNLYIIWDTKENKQWVTPKGKGSWPTPGRAKNAYSAQQPYGKAFRQQTRYECWKATIDINKCEKV